MKYKLLPTWRMVEEMGFKVHQLLWKIETAGSPPAGVAGTRIVRGYRSEIDKKSKRFMDQKREQMENHYGHEMKLKIAISVKRIEESFEAKLSHLQIQLSEQKHGGGGTSAFLRRQALQEEIAKHKQEKALTIRKKTELMERQFEQYFKRQLDAHMEALKRKIAPKGFHWRLKYALDTYGGKAYAGAMVVTVDPKGRGHWRKIKEIISPTKK